jgi:hypothetical protein
MSIPLRRVFTAITARRLAAAASLTLATGCTRDSR